MSRQPHIAYFSAEFGLDSSLPIYAGGLGVLAGDILKQAADDNLPIVGIGLFYHHGFFRQVIGPDGQQEAEEFVIHPHEVGLEQVEYPETGDQLKIEIDFPSEPAEVKVWQRDNLYLLDAAVPENEPFEVEYTGHLYEGDWAPKVAQEVILGVGGVRLVRKLGLDIDVWHLNDDHAALSILERLREAQREERFFDTALEKVREDTVFTTHTPVAGAESSFAPEFIRPYIEKIFVDVDVDIDEIMNLGGLDLPGRETFSFSVLALRMAHRINGVSQRHAQVSRKLWSFVFPEQEEAPVVPITNGVHVGTWISEPIDDLYRKYLGRDYQRAVDSHESWRILANVDSEGVTDFKRDLWRARQQCKRDLIDRLPSLVPEKLPVTDYGLRVTIDALFLGFARRFAPYKQADTLVRDLDRLAAILTNTEHPVYLFISGKSHDGDPVGGGILKQIMQAAQDPRINGHIIFLENYNVDVAKVLIPGVDVWLNTPRVPMEASGTSGMKALYNGVLNVSVADGWWYEVVNSRTAGQLDSGLDSGIARQLGFTIGLSDPSLSSPPSKEETAQELYNLLENEIVPLFYQRSNGIPVQWLEMVKNALVQLGQFYNTRRMLNEYQQELYV